MILPAGCFALSFFAAAATAAPPPAEAVEPTAKAPFTVPADPAVKKQLIRQIDEYMALPSAQVRAHPAAAFRIRSSMVCSAVWPGPLSAVRLAWSPEPPSAPARAKPSPTAGGCVSLAQSMRQFDPG